MWLLLPLLEDQSRQDSWTLEILPTCTKSITCKKRSKDWLRSLLKTRPFTLNKNILMNHQDELYTINQPLSPCHSISKVRRVIHQPVMDINHEVSKNTPFVLSFLSSVISGSIIVSFFVHYGGKGQPQSAISNYLAQLVVKSYSTSIS